MLDLTTLRQDYLNAELSESDVNPNPLVQFANWFKQAQDAQVPEPNAMTLATVDANNQPSARIVLIKEARQDGFVWFTNYDSRKGHDLREQPKASLLFFWQQLERQVRVEGIVSRVNDAESDAYYHSRPINSKLGAWSSPQSQVIADRSVIEAEMQRYTSEFSNQPPRPPHWGGYILKPTYFEFWQGRASRLHDRIAYQLAEDGNWQIVRLAP
ncbi:Pyridoxine/pyridoxamine 5'-phosphate oxidase [Ephemeroptericola cinctiostellae]|uniref:Pyridoxine/pyridoxamine 5'-phosphate oxidase n=1 Tax=Ephemeroptericola cinctiostellae TaxID=2268024 RepID=A0A345DA71_9BURK|nr:pyridoxamine 5'-phosphate oxidase [Ephemeroptericola cinctiostellae]AXF85259.1 Pyridoxine/pyridoxamine 5'-phosphate oxidase [Ephemeroptericola cinctiostellae]